MGGQGHGPPTTFHHFPSMIVKQPHMIEIMELLTPPPRGAGDQMRNHQGELAPKAGGTPPANSHPDESTALSPG